MNGIVFDIQKFSIHDGPGIRTTVFLKGCPLRCLWCHNPESQEKSPEISLIPAKCIGCGYCFKACPQGGHVMGEDANRLFLRESCQRCGVCTEKCYAKALELIGREMTVEEVIFEVEKDAPFYETSGGGMTVSGGEPLFQFEFTLALLQEARRRGLHTCVETSGFASFDRLERIRPFVDLFLYDYKETDPVRHQEVTGVPQKIIIDNLIRLDQLGAKSILRCPIIPGLNARDDHFAGIAAMANSLKNILEVNLMPYHPLGKSKSERIGKTSVMEEVAFPEDSTVAAWEAAVAAATRVPVKKGG